MVEKKTTKQSKTKTKQHKILFKFINKFDPFKHVDCVCHLNEYKTLNWDTLRVCMEFEESMKKQQQPEMVNME